MQTLKKLVIVTILATLLTSAAFSSAPKTDIHPHLLAEENDRTGIYA